MSDQWLIRALVGPLHDADAAALLGPNSQSRRVARSLGLERAMPPPPRHLPARRIAAGPGAAAGATDFLSLQRSRPRRPTQEGPR